MSNPRIKIPDDTPPYTPEEKRVRGRPINNDTKLGRLIVKQGLRSYVVAGEANISPRLLTEYCAGRREMTQQHILSLCRVLRCNPWDIIEDVDDEYQDEVTTLTDPAKSTGGISGTRTVEDLQRMQNARLSPRQSRLRVIKKEGE